MSWTKEITLWCDRCTAKIVGGESLKTLKKDAAEQGWTRGKMTGPARPYGSHRPTWRVGDFCQPCSDVAENEES